MFQKILRERRRNGWKSRRKWRKAQELKRREEERIREAKGYAKPDLEKNVDGVVIGVHILRDRFRGSVELRFEFHRKEGRQPQLATDFGEADLAALKEAVDFAMQCCERQRQESKSAKLHVVDGHGGSKPSKASSTPRVNQRNRK